MKHPPVCNFSNNKWQVEYQTAEQGVVSIENRDAGSPQIKKIRVVSTVEYFLTDLSPHSPAVQARPWFDRLTTNRNS